MISNNTKFLDLFTTILIRVTYTGFCAPPLLGYVTHLVNSVNKTRWPKLLMKTTYISHWQIMHIYIEVKDNISKQKTITISWVVSEVGLNPTHIEATTKWQVASVYKLITCNTLYGSLSLKSYSWTNWKEDTTQEDFSTQIAIAPRYVYTSLLPIGYRAQWCSFIVHAESSGLLSPLSYIPTDHIPGDHPHAKD